MTRFVIGPDVVLRLARERASISGGTKLLAPTLLRSEVLSRLYRDVAAGEMSKSDATGALDFLRTLRIRLLGDRVLQSEAWKIAEALSWPDTMAAEYIALTRLQADAFVTLDKALARKVKGTVAVVPYGRLLT